MDIGFVVHHYRREEGTGGYAVELVTALAARHRVTLYAARVHTPPPTGVRVVRVPALSRWAYPTILSFPAAFAAVRQRHDIVHAQGWVTSKADVVTAHVVLAAWRTTVRRSGIRPALGERLFGGWVAAREADLYRRAGAVIAPSQRARDEIRALGRTDGVHVIPHGCDRAMAHAARAPARTILGLPESATVALYVGDPRKGLAEALDALGGAPGVTLLVLSSASGGAWRREADARGVRDRLVWCPLTMTVAEAFAAADLLFHPSRSDTFGLTVAEALAHGLPVIVSRHAGVVDLLRHQHSAWILPDDAPATAARALSTLACDAALRRGLSAGGREVASVYTWRRTAELTEAVYGEVACR